jgi:hypothetical protein
VRTSESSSYELVALVSHECQATPTDVVVLHCFQGGAEVVEAKLRFQNRAS